ncbi:hypothetical protein ANO11243_084980 [Dothideomycetidae sp. 11243]|nr:hypothetical protein ANO11243_084980 [fungal sp. No.11243]
MGGQGFGAPVILSQQVAPAAGHTYTITYEYSIASFSGSTSACAYEIRFGSTHISGAPITGTTNGYTAGSGSYTADGSVDDFAVQVEYIKSINGVDICLISEAYLWAGGEIAGCIEAGANRYFAVIPGSGDALQSLEEPC